MDRTVIHPVSREWGNVTPMVLRGGLGCAHRSMDLMCGLSLSRLISCVTL